MVRIITMYSIYHIPGVKIGCTKNSPRRRVKQQGYEDFEVLETHTCIETATIREKELQAEYGYKVERVGYKAAAVGGQSGGSKTGCNNWEVFVAARNPQKAADARTQSTCIHCGLKGLTGNINRWHNDNCRHRSLTPPTL